jgi:hypothetical protein
LSAQNFVIVTGLSRDGNDIIFNDDGVALARTIQALDPSVTTPVSIEEQTKVIQKEADAYGVNADNLKKSTTTVTAYVTSINGDKITLDYVDVYYGKVAQEKRIEDGECNDCTVDEVPYHSVYYRNKNSQLRTFTVSQDVIVLDPRNRTTTLGYISDQGLSWLAKDKFSKNPNLEYRQGRVFAFTFNGKGEVFSIRDLSTP